MTDTTTTGTTDTTTTGTTGTTTATAPWHTGIFDAEVLGHAQNKGWLPADAKDAPASLAKAVKAHMEAQKLIGVPADRVLRLPEASAQPAELDAFWQRLGAPKEAKEVDWSGVKTATGEPIDAKLTERLTAAALATRAPKDVAIAIGREAVKYIEDQATERSTILAGKVAEEKAWLDQKWPAAFRRQNMFVAEQALGKIGAAAGLTPEEIKTGWDAISKVGGIGASRALEMLRTIGERMGEGKFVSMSDGKGGDMPMTTQAAKDEIKTLANDKAFQERRQNGGVAENARWKTLHKIAYNSESVAA